MYRYVGLYSKHKTMRYIKDVYEQVQKRRYQRIPTLWLGLGFLHEVHDKWTKATSTFFKDFQCYAICGVTKLLHVNKKYWSISNQNIDDSSTSIGPLCTLYELANMYLSNYITNVKGNVMHLCMKCYMN